MPTFDVDECNDLMAKAMPWEFSVKIGGKTYKTRPPSVAEIGLLSRMKGLSDEAGFKLLDSLFEGAKPPRSAWTLPRINTVLQGYLSFFVVTSEKNSRAVTSKIRELVTETEASEASGG
jgi:hypothetical protein